MRLFFPIALGLTAVLFISYVNDQQLLRLGANTIPKQRAEDLAQQIASSPDATTTLTTTAHVDIATSLAPYVVVYDSFGNPIVGTGYLDNALPQIPPSVFDVARSQGSDMLTWQPRIGVRSAIVVVPVNDGAGGYVLGGESLRYVEQQEDLLTFRVALGWVATMIAIIAGLFVIRFLKVKN